MCLRNPTVLITGGGQRLGLALTREALALGLDVIVHYRTHAAPLKRLLRLCPELTQRIYLIQAELHPQRAQYVISAALQCAPKLCGLVNNAAVFSPGTIRSGDHLAHMLKVNALVPYALGKAFRRHVRRGWIINITDARAAIPSMRYQNYRISKLLLERLTIRQALHYAPAVRVNAIAPGAILRSPTTRPEEFRNLVRRIPLRTGGRLDDLRRAFAYLVNASSVTGQVLYVDGGWHIAP